MGALRGIVKTSAWIAGILFALILLIAGAATLVWFKPNLVLRDSVVRWALGKQTFLVFPKGYPETLRVSVVNERTWSQVATIDASPFCVRIPSVGVDACLNKFHVEASMRFGKRGIGLERIGPIETDFETFRLKPVAKAEEKEAEKKPGGWPELYLLPNLNLQPIRLAIAEGEIESGGKGAKPIRLHGELRFEDSEYEDEKFSFFADWSAELPFDPKRVSVKGEGWVSYDRDLNATLVVHAPHSGKAPGARLELNAAFSLKTLEGIVKGKGEITSLIPLLPKVEIEEFEIRRKKTLSFSAKLAGDLAIGAPVSEKRHAMPAPVFQTHARADAEGSQDANGEWKFGLRLDPVKQYGSVLSATVRATYGKELKIEESKLELRIAEFRETVRGLARTQWAVITPFNALRGPVSLTIGDPDAGKGGMPIRFESKLASRAQKLISHADGVLKLSPSNVPERLDLKFVFDEVTLQAPAVDPIVPMPKVFGDPRIIAPSMGINAKPDAEAELTSGPTTSSGMASETTADREDRRARRKRGEPRSMREKVAGPSGSKPTATPFASPSAKAPVAASKESSFPWAVDIDTGAEPIRVLYGLFRPDAPFRVQGRIASDADARFNIQFDKMTIEFLKRRADVEFLRVRLEDQLRVDGRLAIKRTDCTIYATLHKDGPDTDFRLRSEPEFNEDEIVAMLLFNERASDLDDNSKRSVDDTQQALRRKSLGFFSFFVLASTPVESVAYDPTTKVYSARVSLPGGVSATVGSDWDKTQDLTLMKRLGGKWILSVGTVTDSTSGQTRQESLIEWWNRY